MNTRKIVNRRRLVRQAREFAMRNNIGAGLMYPNALKLRNEPEEFFAEPRKPQAKVTLPRVKWLERPDP